jgi:hypothetical protein
MEQHAAAIAEQPAYARLAARRFKFINDALRRDWSPDSVSGSVVSAAQGGRSEFRIFWERRQRRAKSAIVTGLPESRRAFLPRTDG